MSTSTRTLRMREGYLALFESILELFAFPFFQHYGLWAQTHVARSK